MSNELPPPVGGDLRAWAEQLVDYLSRQGSLPYINAQSKATVDGILGWDPATNEVKVSSSGSFNTFGGGGGGPEVNDLTVSVTWADIPDANVPVSAVTQHQAALSITESQISDLQDYLPVNPSEIAIGATSTGGRRLFVEGDTNANSYANIVNSTSGNATLGFGDSASDTVGFVQYRNGTDDMRFGVGAQACAAFNQNHRAEHYGRDAQNDQVIYVDPGRADNIMAIWSNNTDVVFQIGHLNSANTADVDLYCQGSAGNLRLINNSTLGLAVRTTGGINMPNLPTSSSGLAAGDIWNDAGTIKIV